MRMTGVMDGRCESAAKKGDQVVDPCVCKEGTVGCIEAVCELLGVRRMIARNGVGGPPGAPANVVVGVLNSEQPSV